VRCMDGGTRVQSAYLAKDYNLCAVLENWFFRLRKREVIVPNNYSAPGQSQPLSILSELKSLRLATEAMVGKNAFHVPASTG
jgi:hypothetical protein